jgi:hypothetical protein
MRSGEALLCVDIWCWNLAGKSHACADSLPSEPKTAQTAPRAPKPIPHYHLWDSHKTRQTPVTRILPLKLGFSSPTDTCAVEKHFYVLISGVEIWRESLTHAQTVCPLKERQPKTHTDSTSCFKHTPKPIPHYHPRDSPIKEALGQELKTRLKDSNSSRTVVSFCKFTNYTTNVPLEEISEGQ